MADHEAEKSPAPPYEKTSHIDDEKDTEALPGLGTAEELVWDEAEEKRLLRKIDVQIVPFITLLYLLSFLDRVNIGQAKLSGLQTDLHMTNSQYLTTLSIFFVGYVITETPSNIALKYLRPSRWIPFLMISWGIVATLLGVVKSYEGLATARFFLGLCESGLFPGLNFYLAQWYKRRELSLRVSLFFIGATLAGAFGGILAYGISQMNGVGGYSGWRWIFILEGLATTLVGCMCPWLVHDFPEDAKFITERERAIVVARLKVDHGAAGSADFSWKHILIAMRDWKTWVYMFTYIGVAMPLYALALFSPTIIAALGKWTKPQSQLLSTPPYVLAVFTTLGTALLSDKMGKRGVFMIGWMLLTILGYSMLISLNPLKHPVACYVALFIAVASVAPCISTCITWCGNNLGPTYKRATSMGMMFTLGNSGGIVASEVYRARNSPQYIPGHAVSLGFAAMACLLSVVLNVYFSRENARRDREYPALTAAEAGAEHEQGDSGRLHATAAQIKAWRLDGMTDQQVVDLGDRHPGFRYLT